MTNKMIACLAITAATLGAPVLCLAQLNAPLTHAEVRADVAPVEQACHMPNENGPNYPADIQAREVKIAAQDGQQLSEQPVGGVAGCSTASGAAAPSAMHASCVGPVSFCNVFFGS